MRLKKAKRRKRRREVGEKDPEGTIGAAGLPQNTKLIPVMTVYEGEAKLYLKLEMLQLMLRHQLVAVQKAWGISKEIEVSPAAPPLIARLTHSSRSVTDNRSRPLDLDTRNIPYPSSSYPS
jgi:hypothetical protein